MSFNFDSAFAAAAASPPAARKGIEYNDDCSCFYCRGNQTVFQAVSVAGFGRKRNIVEYGCYSVSLEIQTFTGRIARGINLALIIF